MTHTKLKYSINSFLMRQRIYYWIVIAGPNLELCMLPFNLQPLLHHISSPLLPEHNLFLYNSAKGKGMGWLSLMSRSVEIKLLPFGFCLFPWVLIFAFCKKSVVLQDSPTFSCHGLPTACSNLAPLPSQSINLQNITSTLIPKVPVQEPPLQLIQAHCLCPLRSQPWVRKTFAPLACFPFSFLLI